MKYQQIVDGKSRSDWESLINEWVHNETDRAILKRRILDGATFEQLAEEFGFSTVQIWRRLSKCQEQLFKHVM